MPGTPHACRSDKNNRRMSHTHPNNRGLIGACNPTVLTFVLDSRFSGDLPAGMPSPQLQERENVGRCDHAWASYFHANRSTLASRIFCLKDSYQAHTMFPPVLARDLVEGSHDGFACAYRMLDLRHRHPKAWDQEPTLCDVSDMGRWQLATYDKPHDQNRNRNRNRNQNRTQTQGPSPSPRHENRTDGFAAYNGVSIVLASFASFWPLASLASTNAGCYRAGSHGFIIIIIFRTSYCSTLRADWRACGFIAVSKFGASAGPRIGRTIATST